MKPLALLVSTATDWLGTARMPYALYKAGFEVLLLTPRNSLTEKSRFVTRIRHLPDHATATDWVLAFAATVETNSPALVLPGDDMAFRLLQMLVLSPPRELSFELHLELAKLIRSSLGDPAYYRTSVDKTLLPAAAEALGVRVPSYAIVSTPEEAERMLGAVDGPLVLKRGYGFAGQGVAICSSREELQRAFSDFARADAADLEPATGVRLLAQAYVPGRIVYYGIAAWKGLLLAGFAMDKLVVNPEPTGPATVVRYYRAPEIRDFAERLVGGFGISGLLHLDCVSHERTGEAYLLEINRRIGPGTFRGALVRVDMCAALRAALDGLPSPSRSDLEDGESGVMANFPQEWLRDPESHYLRDYPVDVPWEEPELIEAMLALGHSS